ncbi:MAG TPA: DUF4129 domain-containing protein [Acidimicrobiales bacterium]|nr:DUF4129 domain-containing protein [Acidimicrobiales bacterium]
MREPVAGLAVLLLLLSAPAHAEEVPAAELRRRAAAAADRPHDRTAMAAVRAVDRVDGRPVDIERALADAEGDELVSRLRTLARSGAGTAPVGEAEARAQARDILDGRRFREADPPRPLRGVLEWLGDRLRPVGKPLGDLWDELAEQRLLQLLLGLTVVLGALAVALRMVRRRNAAAVLRDRERRHDGRPEDPAALERAADGAERRGDLDLAVRLRFRAGLLRLDRGGAVDLRPSLTAGELVRQVPSPTLRGLTRTFEAVAYGGRRASAGDADAARHGWPRVLEEARR